jgi:hypothetical protein
MIDSTTNIGALMPWSLFLTILAQVVIGSAVAFFVTAIAFGIVKGMRK